MIFRKSACAAGAALRTIAYYELHRARENRSTPLFPTRRVLSGCAALPSPFPLSRLLPPSSLTHPSRSRRVSTIFESGKKTRGRLWTGSNSFFWGGWVDRWDWTGWTRFEGPSKKGVARSLDTSPSLLEIFARDEKIIDPKDYVVDLRENFPRMLERMKRKFFGARDSSIRAWLMIVQIQDDLTFSFLLTLIWVFRKRTRRRNL